DALVKALRIKLQKLVVTRWNHARIIRERAVNQLARQHHSAFTAESEADLAGGQVDFNVAVKRFLDELAEFAHGLSRDDDVGHASGPFRSRQSEARQPVTVGRGRSKDRLIVIRNVQKNAIEIVAGLLGRNREPRAVY